MDVPWPAILLIATLCLASAGVWWWLLSRQRALLRLARAAAPLRSISPWAIGLTALWLLNRVVIEIDGWLRGDPDLPFALESVLDNLRTSAVLQAGLFVIFWMLVSAGAPGGAMSLGVTDSRFSRQCGNGLITITAAWLPVFATLLATYPLRSAERQHAVLRMLQEHPSFEAYFWAILSAVVMAPLIEELLFRVILQSWLATHVGRLAGWLVSAAVFASVHGFPDSLAILPLALILGAAWHLTRSYWTIVIAHALFNAVMLVLDALLPEG
jgi:membrane protease YdiL (CAAX protease family)